MQPMRLKRDEHFATLISELRPDETTRVLSVIKLDRLLEILKR